MAVQTMATRGTMTRLRQVLVVDAVIEATLGTMLVLGAQPLAELMGMGNALTFMGAGVGLWLFAAWLFRLARAETLPRFQVLLVAELNLAWTIGAALLLMTGWLPLTPFAKWALIATADVTATLAALQFFFALRGRHD